MLAGLWLSFAAAAAAAADGADDRADDGAAGDSVLVKTLDNGTRMIYNESPVERQRRRSFRLLSPPSDHGLDRMIPSEARLQGLSPRLVQAVVQVESGYNPRALSSKGAMGLMQLMPETAADLGVDDPFDPAQNLRGGVRYLRMQLQRYRGDLEKALAAYNAGPTTVDRHGGIPPYRETREYVAKVLGLYQDAPPRWLKEHVRSEAADREMERAAELAEAEESRGAKVYVTRDENNRLVMTTEPPGTP